MIKYHETFHVNMRIDEHWRWNHFICCDGHLQLIKWMLISHHSSRLMQVSMKNFSHALVSLSLLWWCLPGHWWYFSFDFLLLLLHVSSAFIFHFYASTMRLLELYFTLLSLSPPWHRCKDNEGWKKAGEIKIKNRKSIIEEREKCWAGRGERDTPK